jgi:hypothetical protein
MKDKKEDAFYTALAFRTVHSATQQMSLVEVFSNTNICSNLLKKQ